MCGAMVACRVGKKAVVTKCREKIRYSKADAGFRIDIFTIPSEETTYSVVIHPSENVDERKLILKKAPVL